jgi:CRISPR type III-A-associated protein Csm2
MKMPMNNQYNSSYSQSQPILDCNLILNSGLEKTEEILEMVEKFSSSKETKVSPSQLRDLYDVALKLKENPSKVLIAKLIIKMEYAYKRKNIEKQFYDEIKKLLNTLLKNFDEKKANNFVDFMEALIAYSKETKSGGN